MFDVKTILNLTTLGCIQVCTVISYLNNNSSHLLMDVYIYINLIPAATSISVIILNFAALLTVFRLNNHEMQMNNSFFN
jgi:hypothetical protein